MKNDSRKKKGNAERRSHQAHMQVRAKPKMSSNNFANQNAKPKKGKIQEPTV